MDSAAYTVAMSEIAERINHFNQVYEELPDTDWPSENFNPAVHDRDLYQQAAVVTEAALEVYIFLGKATTEQFESVTSNLPKFKRDQLYDAMERIIRPIEETLNDIKIRQPSNEVSNRGSNFHLKARAITEGYRDLYNILGPLLNFFDADLTNKGQTILAEISSRMEVLKRERQDAEVRIAAMNNLHHLDGIIKGHLFQMWAWLALLFIGAGASVWYLTVLFGINDNHMPDVGVDGLIESSQFKISTGLLVFKGLGKLLIASITIGFCVVCSRNYQSHAHNLVVNQHRRSSVLNFLQMYNNISSNDHKPELVKHAMESIFAHANTGFLSKQNAEFQTLNPLINAVVKKAV